MTPLGHLSVSYITGKSLKNISLPAVVIGGMLPDIDFLFIFFDWFNNIHRVVSHNLLFIICIALSGALFSSRDRWKAVGLGLFLGGCIHLLIDSCMDNNPTNGIGLALLWPFYDEFFSPFNILHLSQNRAGWNDPVRMFVSIIPNMIYEVPFYAVSLVLYARRNRKRAAGNQQ